MTNNNDSFSTIVTALRKTAIIQIHEYSATPYTKWIIYIHESYLTSHYV